MDAQMITRILVQGSKLIVATFFVLIAINPTYADAKTVGGERVDISVGTSSPFSVITTEQLSCTNNGYLRWWFSDNTVNTTGANSSLNPLTCVSGFYATSTALQTGALNGATIIANYGTNATATGYYYAYICDSNPCTTSNIEYFIEVYYDVSKSAIFDGFTYYVPTNISTTSTTQIPKNIEILNPTYGTTTATTTFNYQIKFKIPFSIDFRPTTTRTVIIKDAITNDIEYTATTTIAKNSTENIVLTGTATTSEGSKYITAYYADLNGNIYSEVDEVFFNVATNTYFALTGLLSPRDNPNDLSQINCAIYDVGCQFQKALTFLFVPPSDSLNKWSNLWQTIAEKKPFGYFTVTRDALLEIDISGSSAFDLGTIPFMDSIFTPFRTLMAGILWSIFAIFFYKNRLINLDI